MKKCLGLFIGGLVAVFVATAGVATADEFDRVQGLSTELQLAYHHWTGNLTTKDRETVREELRLFVLSEKPETVADERRKAQQAGLKPGFLSQIDDAVAWGAAMRDGDPQIAYELSKTYATETGKRFRTELTGHIASLLLALAARNGHSPARYDRVQDSIEQWGATVGSEVELTRLANEGYLPAQIDLYERYRDGNGLLLANDHALYWLMRAGANGMAVERDIRLLAPRMTRYESDRVREWLARGSKPPLPLYPQAH